MRFILEPGPHGQVFTGAKPVDVVTAMKNTAMFYWEKTIREYADVLVGNAKDFFGVDLVVKGETDEELAESLLAALVEKGLGRWADDAAPVPKVR